MDTPELDITSRALRFATKAHKGQVRKYTGQPYIHHPICVAGMCRTVGLPDHAVAAAYLHDVVEDCDVTIEDITKEFGDRVAHMVSALTDPTEGNRATRKQAVVDKLRNAHSDIQTIKLADLIDNSRSILEHDPSFAVQYMKEKRALLDVLNFGRPLLVMYAEDIMRLYYLYNTKGE